MKNWFSHDEGARNDPKLIKVLMRLGQAGKGVYWDIIEMLYEQDGYLLLSECESYAFALRTDCDLLTKLLTEFELFQNDGTSFWSNAVLTRLELRKGKSAKASESAAKRWQNANAMRTHSEGNASKGKESKGKEIKENNSLRSSGEGAGESEKKIEVEVTAEPDPVPAQRPASHTRGAGGTYPRDYDGAWPVQLRPTFDSPAFHAAWARWGKYLLEIGKPHGGEISEQTDLDELSRKAGGDEARALEIINMAISRRWKALIDHKEPIHATTANFRAAGPGRAHERVNQQRDLPPPGKTQRSAP
jgi:hypothetical protein